MAQTDPLFFLLSERMLGSTVAPQYRLEAYYASKISLFDRAKPQEVNVPDLEVSPAGGGSLERSPIPHLPNFDPTG